MEEIHRRTKPPVEQQELVVAAAAIGRLSKDPFVAAEPVAVAAVVTPD